MQKKLMMVIGVVAVAVVVGIWFFTSNPMNPQPSMTGQGRVVFAVTDAAAALENVTAVNITVTKTEVQSVEKGWVSVSDKTQVFDLLALKSSNALALLADAKLDAGTYNQIRLTVGKVEVTQAGKVNQAKLPSSSLKIVGNLVVKADSTSTAVLDFMVDKSLHITGNGLFVFAPVVRLVTQSNANATTIEVDGRVKVSGGKVEADTTVGMDEKGETGEGLEIDEDADVEVVGGEIKVGLEVQTGLGPVTVNLSSQNSSGISGKATITEADGRAQVKLELTGSPLGLPQPAHVHVGSCATLGDVKYPLNNTLNGRSTTVLSVSMATLKAGLPLAVNVHKSIAEPGTYVACGDIKF